MRFMRWLAVLGLVSASFVPAHVARAASPSAPAGATTTITEPFTGGSGDGTPTASLHFPLGAVGHYMSNGELGFGTYDIVYPGAGATRGTISFRRSDGTMLRGSFTLAAPSACGLPAKTSVDCLSARLIGTADIASVVVTIAAVVRFPFNYSFLMSGTLTLHTRHGFALVNATGATQAFGGIEHHGDARTAGVVDIQRTPSGAGYWVVNAAGQVFAFGDARFLGNADYSRYLRGQRIASMSPTPTGQGYWLFTTTGVVLHFGDARSFGDLHSHRLSAPIVDSVATPSGRGYYLVGRDGGVFTFGDARFRGSTGRLHLAQPIVGIALPRDNPGYWLVAADGGVFSFDAQYWGSTAKLRLSRPVVGMVPYGEAYLMVGSDGTLYSFSSVPLFGFPIITPGSAPVAGIAAIG